MLGTIGYERSTLEDFITTLTVVDTDVLVDIRERAQSRRVGFSKKALERALLKAGIVYLHFPELGDPKEGREAARNQQYDRFREIFAGVMRTPKAAEALARVQELASSKRICLMCFERDHNHCHRKIVAEALEARMSIKARHLGVRIGAADGGSMRRVLYTDQGAAAPL